MPITKTDVDALPQNSILWDDGKGSVSGFGVRKQRSHPVFILKYRIEGRQRWHSIGRFGSPWTVDQARREAKRLLGEVATGGDPSRKNENTDTASQPATVGELCDRYMQAAEAGAILTRFNRPKKTSTLAIDVGRISRHIKPLIGQMTVSDVDTRAVKKLIQDITIGKTAADLKTKKRGRAIVTGGAATAARVADLLSGIMTWAMDEGLIDRNPVHRVRRHRSEAKQRFLRNEELTRLATVLRAGKDDEEKTFHPFAATIIKLLCLTGCRVSEIGGLKWSEFDPDQKCLWLEDTKSGKSLRAIGSAAVNIIKDQPRLADSQFVFPNSAGSSAYQGMNKEARRIFDAADLADASCHSLRHTFASAASGLGYSDGTIAGLLGHKGRGVTSRYVHRPDQALVLAAEEVSTAMMVHFEQVPQIENNPD
jgi:integrase